MNESYRKGLLMGRAEAEIVAVATLMTSMEPHLEKARQSLADAGEARFDGDLDKIDSAWSALAMKVGAIGMSVIAAAEDPLFTGALS